MEFARPPQYTHILGHLVCPGLDFIVDFEPDRIGGL